MNSMERLRARAFNWSLIACLFVTGCAVTVFSIATGDFLTGLFVGSMWATVAILIVAGIVCLVAAIVVIARRARRRWAA